jgi:hypothetical protein
LLAGVLTGTLVVAPALHVYRNWSDSAPLREGRDYIRASSAVVDDDMRLLTRFEQDYKWLHGLSPAVTLRRNLRGRLVAVADGQFAGYRSQAGSSLDSFDWRSARACLQRALLLASSDASIRGRLALAEAYQDLLSTAVPPGELHRKLTTAASLLAAWPDPHLALARFYVYRQKNLGLAVAEWHTAEKLGFRIGPREWEQEADGYLGRVEGTFGELRAATTKDKQQRLHALLGRDVARARQRYEPIAGFGKVSNSLGRLDQIESTVAALQTRRASASPAPRRYRKARSWR